MYCLKLLRYFIVHVLIYIYILFVWLSVRVGKKSLRILFLLILLFLLHVLCIHLFSIVSILLQIKKFIDSRAGSNVPKVHVMQLHLD